MLVLDTILNLFPIGIVLVTHRGEVVLTNGIARDLLRNGSVLAVRDGRLIASSKVYQKELIGILHLESQNQAWCSSGFSMTRPGLPPISVSGVAVMRRTEKPRRNSARQILVLISDPAYHVAIDSQLAAKLFDLTPSEALIAEHLLKGEDVKQIAQELDLSKHTVRNHLKRLYSKTNTHQHCELLHVLLRSPAALHLTPDGVRR